MPSIDEMMAERNAAVATSQQGSSDELWLRDRKTADSVTTALVHSLYTGASEDPYMLYYRAHDKPHPGRQWGDLVYCPVTSPGGDPNFNCEGCKSEWPLKHRFGMWLYVYAVFYDNLTGQEKVGTGAGDFKQVQYKGNLWYMREHNAPRLWNASAWKDGPFDDVIRLVKELGDLRNMRYEIKATGTSIDKRIKFYPDMGSGPLDGALYDASIAKIVPVRQWLMNKIAVAPVTEVQAAEVFGDAVVPPTFGAEAPAAAPAAPAFAAPAEPSDAAPAIPRFKPPEKPEALL